ncbi:hypothetical protein E2562_016048 [Oryza meyeriana var. granulata]|uniref:Uncharacterized protein n=1 Tax=Oryza meyeriana var. granulata TaxID=110450 RepID=A0A6G1BKU5_9ORYZ|nr:hypothetical protein E2562_016048 [Oryza meyeriana var. granulata]
MRWPNPRGVDLVNLDTLSHHHTPLRLELSTSPRHHGMKIALSSQESSQQSICHWSQERARTSMAMPALVASEEAEIELASRRLAKARHLDRYTREGKATV